MQDSSPTPLQVLGDERGSNGRGYRVEDEDCVYVATGILVGEDKHRVYFQSVEIYRKYPGRMTSAEDDLRNKDIVRVTEKYKVGDNVELYAPEGQVFLVQIESIFYAKHKTHPTISIRAKWFYHPRDAIQPSTTVTTQCKGRASSSSSSSSAAGGAGQESERFLSFAAETTADGNTTPGEPLDVFFSNHVDEHPLRVIKHRVSIVFFPADPAHSLSSPSLANAPRWPALPRKGALTRFYLCRYWLDIKRKTISPLALSLIAAQAPQVAKMTKGGRAALNEQAKDWWEHCKDVLQAVEREKRAKRDSGAAAAPPATPTAPRQRERESSASFDGELSAIHTASKREKEKEKEKEIRRSAKKDKSKDKEKEKDSEIERERELVAAQLFAEERESDAQRVAEIERARGMSDVSPTTLAEAAAAAAAAIKEDEREDAVPCEIDLSAPIQDIAPDELYFPLAPSSSSREGEGEERVCVSVADQFGSFDAHALTDSPQNLPVESETHSLSLSLSPSRALSLSLCSAPTTGITSAVTTANNVSAALSPTERGGPTAVATAAAAAAPATPFAARRRTPWREIALLPKEEDARLVDLLDFRQSDTDLAFLLWYRYNKVIVPAEERGEEPLLTDKDFRLQKGLTLSDRLIPFNVWVKDLRHEYNVKCGRVSRRQGRPSVAGTAVHTVAAIESRPLPTKRKKRKRAKSSLSFSSEEESDDASEEESDFEMSVVKRGSRKVFESDDEAMDVEEEKQEELVKSKVGRPRKASLDPSVLEEEYRRKREKLTCENAAKLPLLRSESDRRHATALLIPTKPCFDPALQSPQETIDFELFFTASMREINRLRKMFLLTKARSPHEQFVAVFSFEEHFQAMRDKEEQCNYFDKTEESELIVDGSLLSTRGELMQHMLTALHQSRFETRQAISALHQPILRAFENWSVDELRTVHGIYHKFKMNMAHYRKRLMSKSVKSTLDYIYKYLHSANKLDVLSEGQASNDEFPLPSSPELSENEQADGEEEEIAKEVICVGGAPRSSRSEEKMRNVMAGFRKNFDEFSMHQFLSVLIAWHNGILTPSELVVRLSHLLYEATFTGAPLSLSLTGEQLDAAQRAEWTNYRAAALQAKKALKEELRSLFPDEMQDHILKIPDASLFGGNL